MFNLVNVECKNGCKDFVQKVKRVEFGIIS